MSFQPAELAKIAIILVLATYFNRRPRLEAMRLKDLIVPGVLVLIPVALIIKQPDLGSGILVALVAASLILFVGVRWRTLVGCVLTLVLLLAGDLAFPQGLSAPAGPDLSQPGKRPPGGRAITSCSP